MAFKWANFCGFLQIPDADYAWVSANRQEIVILTETNWSTVICRTQIAQLEGLAVEEISDEDVGGEADWDEVLGGPVDEIQVEVILEGGGL